MAVVFETLAGIERRDPLVTTVGRQPLDGAHLGAIRPPWFLIISIAGVAKGLPILGTRSFTA